MEGEITMFVLVMVLASTLAMIGVYASLVSWIATCNLENVSSFITNYLYNSNII